MNTTTWAASYFPGGERICGGILDENASHFVVPQIRPEVVILHRRQEITGKVVGFGVYHDGNLQRNISAFGGDVEFEGLGPGDTSSRWIMLAIKKPDFENEDTTKNLLVVENGEFWSPR